MEQSKGQGAASKITAAVARKPRTKKAAIPAPAPEVLETFKGFDRNWQCREFQYAIGESYKHDGSVSVCRGGFHSCEMPLDTWNYYSPATSVYAVVSVTGPFDRQQGKDTKVASAEITIKAELRLPEVIRRAVAWVLDRAKGNTATERATHAAATGYSGLPLRRATPAMPLRRATPAMPLRRATPACRCDGQALHCRRSRHRLASEGWSHWRNRRRQFQSGRPFDPPHPRVQGRRERHQAGHMVSPERCRRV